MREAKSLFTCLAGLALAAALVGCSGGGTPQPLPPSPPPPSVTTTVTPVLLPEMEVTGSGPLGGDPEAVARINAIMPPTLGYHSLTGANALSYAGKLAEFAPQLSGPFSTFSGIAICALDHGVIGAAAYATPDYSAAGAVLIVSGSRFKQLPQIAFSCFVNDVFGGGPGISPCFDSYYMDVASGQVSDRYYVFIGGTNAEMCSSLKSVHLQYSPQPIVI